MVTVVSFHAHPDDESLLTAGTLALASAAGHRVVVVTATRGEAGLTTDADPRSLGRTRMAELRASAAALGVREVRWLGYRDSGLEPHLADSTATPGRPPFAAADVREAAERLAALLRTLDAEVLTVYDAAGGYGHPDHVQVHRVGMLAARLAGTPIVLQATRRGTAFRAGLAVLRCLGHPLGHPAVRSARVFSDAREITHRIDVRPVIAAKRRSLEAHATQRGGGVRTVDALLRLPRPLFVLLLGHEYYVQAGIDRRAGRCRGILDVRSPGPVLTVVEPAG